MNKSYICCFCKTLQMDYGNNPEPVKENGRCCNQCNEKYVIPERIKLVKEEK